jgi:hypothetical protein
MLYNILRSNATILMQVSFADGHMRLDTEERIIFAVSSKQCIFDTTADSYRDINTKNAAWRVSLC